MCGICGIYNERNEKRVTAMLSSIRHRGPDSFTTTLFENHSIGECGLHIVSTKDDVLPLIDEKDSIALLFNGEIYNYKEIKKELLQDGYMFKHKSNSDSDVIIPLYLKYGVDFVRHLKGMFAIALVKSDEIILARDRFGIKPLFYYRSGERLIFGSEIKALLQHPDVPARIDIDALQELTVFGYVFSEEQTSLLNINQVVPGTIVRFNGQEFLKQRYYHSPPPFYSARSEENYHEAIGQLDEVLNGTFTTLLNHGGHDTGVYLSGGIDSTMMAVLSTEILSKPIKTYTLYDRQDAPDLKYARKVSAAIGSEHSEFQVGIQDYLDELPHFIYHYENIMAGGVFDIQGSLSFQIISRHISRSHRVAFTGEGADELFGGYYWIFTHPLGFSDRIRKKAANLPEDSPVLDLIDNLFPQPENEKTYRKNLLDMLMKTGLSNCHLWSVDRSCASFGFEARPPFLYDDLAEFALSLPIEFKIPDKNTTKRILRDSALPYLKKYKIIEIAQRRKYGMPAALRHVGPQVESMVKRLIPADTIQKHPFFGYCNSAMDVLLFDLFYYFMIEKRGRFDTGFQIEELYRGQINERMYDK